MKSLKRWNLAIGTALVLSGLSLAAKPASARMLVCPTQSCGNDCGYECTQPGCTFKLCFPGGCLGNDGVEYPYEQNCQQDT